ncbi:MAG: DEAD/DEAH box helicase [Rickettsiales bacterium]|jgi:ATP-dependent RNA helicase RhlE|nr:DEAD/DEAH box helicase [Rickettsiales bacterium]
MTDFKQLNLSPEILKTLANKNYTKPTPIQTEAIPHLLAGRDLLGIAQTGTGKTAAFSLPILDNLIKSNNRVRANNVRALILTPTRELASQIYNNVTIYGENLNLRSEVIFGGINIKPQITALSRGTDILIATPGRLLDILNQGYIHLMRIEIFVLDEADRMLDMGFINDIQKIISKLPASRQSLLFSATMPNDISNLAKSLLNDPIKIEIAPQSTTAQKIDQKVVMVAKADKPALLKLILNKKNTDTVLVFAKTKIGANNIEKYLNRNHIRAEAIHGNKTQSERDKALESFRNGEINVLIATDIVARGIDIPHITHVINFDLPHDPESYVHRIGRTARAGRNGIAITFCDPFEKTILKAVEKTIGFEIPIDNTLSLSKVKSHSKGTQNTGSRNNRNGPLHNRTKNHTSLTHKKNDNKNKSFSQKKHKSNKAKNNKGKLSSLLNQIGSLFFKKK